MPTPQSTAEIRARRLARFAELTESLAEHLHDEILTAETAQDKRDLTLAFHRITRSGRQTMALQAKLERDEQQQDREAVELAASEARRPAERQRARIRAAVQRLVWTEAERDPYEAERLIRILDNLMAEDDLYDVYLEGPIEAHIKRLCIELGMAEPTDDDIALPTVEAPAPSTAQPNSS